MAVVTAPAPQSSVQRDLCRSAIHACGSIERERKSDDDQDAAADRGQRRHGAEEREGEHAASGGSPRNESGDEQHLHMAERPVVHGVATDRADDGEPEAGKRDRGRGEMRDPTGNGRRRRDDADDGVDDGRVPGDAEIGANATSDEQVSGEAEPAADRQEIAVECSAVEVQVPGAGDDGADERKAPPRERRRETRSPSRRLPSGVTMIGWIETSSTLAAIDVYCSDAVQSRKCPARNTPLTSTSEICVRPRGMTCRRTSRTTHGARSTVAMPIRSQTIVAGSSSAYRMMIAENETATVATTSATPGAGVRMRAAATVIGVARAPAPSAVRSNRPAPRGCRRPRSPTFVSPQRR